MTGLAWDDLDLSTRILEVFRAKYSFGEPTPIQQKCIPLFLAHKDVLAEAPTGSGKTLAFVLPTLHRLAAFQDRSVLRAVVVSPTRELAAQTSRVFLELSCDLGLSVRLATGGSDVSQDIEALSPTAPDVLVATPGRLEDIARRLSASYFRQLEILVLDEADRLLDMGFLECLGRILAYFPKQRRTCLFSATLRHGHLEQEMSYLSLRNPVRIALGDNETSVPEQLCNEYAIVPEHLKLSYLVQLLAGDLADKRVLVFFATCAMVDYFASLMQQSPSLATLMQQSPSLATLMQQSPSLATLSILPLHGRMVQKKRVGLYRRVQQQHSRIVFCTDLAARGLDFTDIDFVVQFDAPKDPSNFAHRCGRTARAGRAGAALILLAPSEAPFAAMMQNRGLRLTPRTTDVATIAEIDLRPAVRADRALLDKSLQAFVSFVRHYREHHASFVLPFAKLDWCGIAKCFALLKIPHVPELSRLDAAWSGSVCAENVDAIAYVDPIRETARQRRLMAPRPAREKTIRSSVPWSKQKAKKLGLKVVKKEKKTQPAPPAKAALDDAELAELISDYREYRRDRGNKSRT